MKILLISNTVSSIILFRKKLIERLVNCKHHVYVLIPYNEKNNSKDLEALNITIQYYKSSRTNINPFKEIFSIFSLYTKIKKIAPDTVFSFFPKPVIFGTLAAYFSGVRKRVAMLEGLGYCFTQRPEPDPISKKILKLLQVFLYRISLPKAHTVLFLNKDDANEIIKLHNIPLKSYEIIGGIGVNPNDYVYSEASSSEPIIFTMVSRLLIDKGIREFISAAKIVHRHHPSAIFKIIGGIDENLGGISKSEFEKWKKENIVQFTGVIKNIKDELIKTSVFVLPSYREGVPKSTQEAMHIGRPIITTDVPGCRETVINNINGFLIPPWDANVLAEKMLFFIDNKESIILMGKESRKIAEKKFNEDIFCDKLVKILTL